MAAAAPAARRGKGISGKNTIEPIVTIIIRAK
jgi:hypothetical protein